MSDRTKLGDEKGIPGAGIQRFMNGRKRNNQVPRGSPTNLVKRG